jgi:hypothetical protein
MRSRDYPQTKPFRSVKVWRAGSGGETIHPGSCEGAVWSGDGVNGMRTPTTLWKRLTRRLGHDHNVLRRRVDVIEAWLVPAAVVIFLALCPLVLAVTGSWVRAVDAADIRAQQTWYPVDAKLLEPVPGPEQADHGANTWITWAPAVWRDHAGVRHTGEVPALGGSRAGNVVTVYLDSRGKVHMPPLTPGEASSRVLEARAGGLAVLAALLVIMVVFARRLMDRRRLAGWESAWLSVGPTWSRHR